MSEAANTTLDQSPCVRYGRGGSVRPFGGVRRRGMEHASFRFCPFAQTTGECLGLYMASRDDVYLTAKQTGLCPHSV